MRAPGDTLFAIGEFIFVIFVFSIRNTPIEKAEQAAAVDLNDFGEPAVRVR